MPVGAGSFLKRECLNPSLIRCVECALSKTRFRHGDELVGGQILMLADQSVDPCLVRLSAVVTAFDRQGDRLAANLGFDDDVNFALLSSEAVNEEL